MAETQRGKFITLEGGEGTGKSTQVQRLIAFLEERGLVVVGTREPGGSPGGEEIRGLLVEGEPGRWRPLTEALLHSAARADHIARLIEPALAQGRWVVSDRFSDSTLAYQGYGYGLSLDMVAKLNAVTSGRLRPDLTIILDMPADEGLKRAGIRADNGGEAEREDRYERMDLTFHERLRAGFLEIARNEPERCVVIDAGAAIDEVANAIRRALTDRLALS
ncbi:MAG: dTMP kinase [Alphaproteobacteria bacterium]|nr:dTMP kinase [Alphaproteobacteria bacterium]